MRLITLFAASFFCISVAAQSFQVKLVEKWSCYDFFDGSPSEVLVGLEVYKYLDERMTYGSVIEAGKRRTADYSIEKSNRRWDFGRHLEPNGETVRPYAIIVKPDGTSLFYDFSESETARPSEVYKCNQR